MVKSSRYDSTFLAFDLGAQSGRAILARFDPGSDGELHLSLDEIHRFPNGPVTVGGHLYWDVLRLWSEILITLEKAGGLTEKVTALGIDTWGVDFGLLDAADRLLGNPYHYRDLRTDGVPEVAYAILPREDIYYLTGIQFMQLNSLYQLLAMRLGHDPLLDIAETFLTMPDLLNFWLTGQKANEFTISTTTQCYNPWEKDWAFDLLSALQIPGKIFQHIIAPASILSELRPAIVRETGLSNIPVIAVGSHDTASAVAAVPAESQDFVFISSGTWSLIGLEIDQPIINQKSLEYNLTNEGGLNGKFRFLKNIMGMWLLEECRREWGRAGLAYSYAELLSRAETASPLHSLIHPGDERFLAPGDMVSRIQAFCRSSGQPVPETPGEIVRCILESLALEYRRVLDELEELYRRPLRVIHIIGGGSQNSLLNQFTADATGRLVTAGPVEATAIGNILAQALATGEIQSLAAGRALVRRSFGVVDYVPGDGEPWDAAFTRYKNICGV